jgi:hypothetical protein
MPQAESSAATVGYGAQPCQVADALRETSTAHYDRRPSLV